MPGLKRLSVTGNIAAQDARASDGADSLTRPAILVHSAPNGEAMVFQSADGEISFDETRIQSVVASHNAKMESLAEGYGGVDKMPVGAWPPILDQHEADSNHRVVGRLASLLRFEIRDVPGVGEKCACACADITFLGPETVSRVKDGRIYHLSIGIDEETNTLGETSTVITPAAPGAMLLKKHQPQKEKKMAKKKLTAAMKQSATRLTKLAAIAADLKKLNEKSATTSKMIHLTAKEAGVTGRLKRLMSAGKLSPAEFKKMDLKKLAGMDDAAVDMVVGTYENREAIIEPGQRGSADAVDFATIGKGLEKTQMTRLAAEVKGDFKRLGKKVRLSSEEEEIGKKPKKDLSGEEDHKDEHELGKKKMSEEPEEKKKDLAAEEDMGGEGQMKQMGDAQAQIDELATQLARIAGMVQELMDAEKEESEMEGEPMEMSADEEDKKKKLGEGEEDKKKLSEEPEDKKKLGAETEEVEGGEKKKLKEELKA